MKKLPQIIKGSNYEDNRGKLYFNNNFDASEIKRIYFIENCDENFVRGWQGHQIEQRWFSAVSGSFEIEVIAINQLVINDFNNVKIFEIEASNCDVLHVPNGFATSIKAKSIDAKLLVMADFLLGEINDEFRQQKI